MVMTDSSSVYRPKATHLSNDSSYLVIPPLWLPLIKAPRSRFSTIQSHMSHYMRLFWSLPLALMVDAKRLIYLVIFRLITPLPKYQMYKLIWRIQSELENSVFELYFRVQISMALYLLIYRLYGFYDYLFNAIFHVFYFVYRSMGNKSNGTKTKRITKFETGIKELKFVLEFRTNRQIFEISSTKG